MLPAVLAIGSALLGGAGALFNHGAKAQAAAENRMSALDNMRGMLSDLDARKEQEVIAALQQGRTLDRATTAAQSSLGANAAMANVEGATVDALNTDVARQRYEAREVLSRNLTNAMTAIARQQQGVLRETQDRIASVQKPSWLATGLNLAGSALNAAASGGFGGGPPSASAMPGAAGNLSVPNIALPDIPDVVNLDTIRLTP